MCVVLHVWILWSFCSHLWLTFSMQTNYLYVYLSIFPSMQRCFVQCNYNYGTCLWKFKCCQHNWKFKCCNPHNISKGMYCNVVSKSYFRTNRNDLDIFISFQLVQWHIVFSLYIKDLENMSPTVLHRNTLFLLLMFFF